MSLKDVLHQDYHHGHLQLNPTWELWGINNPVFNVYIILFPPTRIVIHNN